MPWYSTGEYCGQREGASVRGRIWKHGADGARPKPAETEPDVDTMRFTVVDHRETVSFVAPGHALKMLAAACSRHAKDYRDLILKIADYDAELARRLLSAPASDHESHTTSDASLAAPASEAVVQQPELFRVINAEQLRKSTEPVDAGLVLFNLPAKRIVQVQNSYSDLRRKDKGRLWRDGRPVRAFYSYELPPDWTIVP